MYHIRTVSTIFEGCKFTDDPNQGFQQFYFCDPLLSHLVLLLFFIEFENLNFMDELTAKAAKLTSLTMAL